MSPTMETILERPCNFRRRPSGLFDKERSKIRMSRVFQLSEDRKYKNVFPQISVSPFRANVEKDFSSLNSRVLSTDPDLTMTKSRFR